MRSDFDDNEVPMAAFAEPHQLKKLILKLRWIGLYPDTDLTNADIPPPWQHSFVPEVRLEGG